MKKIQKKVINCFFYSQGIGKDFQKEIRHALALLTSIKKIFLEGGGFFKLEGKILYERYAEVL